MSKTCFLLTGFILSLVFLGLAYGQEGDFSREFEDLKADPIAVVRETCRHLDIDPDFAFVPMPPLNTRSKLPASQSVRLLPGQRAALAERLAPEMRRLALEYDFNVSRWGFA